MFNKNPFKNKIQLVIGAGEVGTSLYNVLKEHYPKTHLRDEENTVHLTRADVLHICTSYNTANFIPMVYEYYLMYQPEMIVIHSSTKIGATHDLEIVIKQNHPNKNIVVVHSPIRGKHPNLEEGIKTFCKYFGGTGAEKAKKLFYPLGMPNHCFKKSQDTEALKLLDTTYLAWNVVFEKAVHEFCKKYNLDFDGIYHHANLTYNSGYSRLGKDNVVRPILDHMDGPIGGHCLLPNCELLKDNFSLAEFILEQNNNY